MDRSLIEQFAAEIPIKSAKSNYEKTLEIVITALGSVSEKLTAITPETIRVFPIGEYTNNSYVDESGEIELAIVSKSPQVAFTDIAFARLIKETKNKKERDALSAANTSHEFMHTLFKDFINLFGNETSLLMTESGIKILCNKELGFKIFIRVGTYNEMDSSLKLSLWNPVDKTIEISDIFSYAENFKEKDKLTNGNLGKVTRILKSIRKTIVAKKWLNSSYVNKYLIEMIAFNIPEKLLMGDDIYKVYIKAINYLVNCSLVDFKNFDKKSKIEDFKLANANYYKIKMFINYVTRLIY